MRTVTAKTPPTIVAVALLPCVCMVSPAASGASRDAQTRGPISSCADCTSDADFDGVVDTLDRCPGSDRGAPVSTRGCAHDSDKDGIHDHEDRCPGSDPATRIDARGCQLDREIALPRVVFALNDATLNRVATRSMRALITTLKIHVDLRIEIAGFTDSRGKAANNLRLSQRRADAVRAYLIGNGIHPSRVSARGFGATQPVGDNDTPWGRAQNRRVVVRVLNL